MDFYQICTKENKNGTIELYPDFRVGRSKDLMVRGERFYAIWDERQGLWSTDEYDVQRLVDEELYAFADEQRAASGITYTVRSLQSFSSNAWNQFKRYIKSMSDNSHQLDDELTFANSEVKKGDYVSRRLPYSLERGDISAWDELVGTLYSVEERAKIEWAIGAVIAGDAKKIQKFIVLYGPAGTGKSTILNVLESLFPGYISTFNAKALGSSQATFATEVFKHNPLVAIQHDGDLSRIEDNTRLNSVISHEMMPMDEKYKAGYSARVNAFLFMGTNQPVKISDAKSGIIRRLIDVHPTGVKIPINHYFTLMGRIDFELGAIAHHCLQVYRDMGKNHYNGYRPLEMMLQTDVFFNFIEANYDVFKSQDYTTLAQAYALYKEYCSNTGIERVLPMYKVREELRNYFDDFKERADVDGQASRSVYFGFSASKFKTEAGAPNTFSLVIEETTSLLDKLFADLPAQYATPSETPKKKWEHVNTTLSDLDTSTLHFVKVPSSHIVIDFDLKDENGDKSLERNLEAASLWPATYAELSKGGNGVHLHYQYQGDASELSTAYSEGIEIKSLLGSSSLRRRLTKCNNVPVATLAGGLPVKEKKVIQDSVIKSEKGLRDLIARNLRKEIHPGTKPSIDFINKILNDAYDSGMSYDVTDLKAKLISFANNSTHQPLLALKIVQNMKFKSEEAALPEEEAADERLAFFDVEVYPNLFVVCWKFMDSPQVVRMINPSQAEIENLIKLKLVGFNCRRYDNHVLYGRLMGYDNHQLFILSQKLIAGDRNAFFGEAYNISYADIYDFASIKQSLKKWQIVLRIAHKELDLPWDEDVTLDMWDTVVEYCVNDVESTEATFKDRMQDFVARQILAELSGLSVNDTTQRHTARIIFGNDRNPQADFLYTDLAEAFPGYEFDRGKSHYRGELVGEGGYVYAEPGIYHNVVELDVASMHPTSIEQLNLFGEYTPRFSALKDARIAIKHRDYESARKMLGGKLAPYLSNEANAAALSYALKIVINIVYGLTSAKFPNPFKDERNIDNIVAKRGALFMIDLKHWVQEWGAQVVHIKTDSIKIAEASDDLIEGIIAYGKKWGYDFEIDAEYEKIALVNDAVFVGKTDGKWKAVGAQFQHPYVYKSLFTNEDFIFEDLVETKQVIKGALYLDYDYDRPMAVPNDGMKFIGRIGRFVPVREGKNGGRLYRVVDDKCYAATGTKNYLWAEADMALDEIGKLDDWSDYIDVNYFDGLVDDAKKAINKFGSFDDFVK
jgi:hypothetical protein